jgi:class 3 adenylate cyclase/pimeloyl-ACP methyl ester carboxylesterase
MTEPRIQYAQTKDGVSIAYWTLGTGKPFVQMPTIPFSHIQLEWEGSAGREFAKRISERHKLIRYDARGTGLSDRGFKTQSIQGYCSDLDAVLDQTTDESVILMGPVNIGPVAVAYAADHPDRVSHLVLWNTYARGADLYQLPALQSFKALRHQDWGIYTNTVAHTAMGWSGVEAARWAEVLRESVTLDDAEPVFEAVEAFDVTDQLERVAVPTLVVHRRNAAVADLQIARKLTASIPNASLTILEGDSVAPVGAEDEFVKALAAFLGDEAPQAHRTSTDRPSTAAVHTILFTDVAGSTALTQRLGDARAREILREHERITREALAAHGGAEVKTMGDGFMTSFTSATAAIECSIAIQRAIENWNAGVGAQHAAPIQVRIGLNAGEPIAEDEDLFGTAVNLAARICARAEGGQILAPVVVRELVAGKGFLLSDIGETELRGFEEPVRLYEVRWREND